MGGPEPYTVKLTYSQNIILEYLLIHATGVENRKQRQESSRGFGETSIIALMIGTYERPYSL